MSRSASQALAVFDKASIYRAGKAVLRDLNLTIQPGQAHVIIGPLGAGKSSLLSALHGDLPAEPPTSLSFPSLGKQRWPSEVCELLTSRAEVSNGSAYFSERYHSRREDDFTLREWLLRDMKEPLAIASTTIDHIAQDLQISEYLDSSIINLSNGQSKRALVARSLLKSPSVLLLDEPFVGLDVKARDNLSKVLGRLHQRGQPQIVMALRPLDDIPVWATHILWLNADGTVRDQGAASSLRQTIINANAQYQKRSVTKPTIAPESEEIVQLERISVSYWGKHVLQDVSWSIRAGERWHLRGSNGSGKTTLLAMILGDHPKIYSNHVVVFGHEAGAGQTVFQKQAEMGHSSPELHRHFPRYLTGRQCLASAFAESFYPKSNLSDSEAALVDEIVRYFEVSEMMHVQLGSMSPAMQRLFLLLQALVKRPRLVILDEPFAGMDATMIERAKAYIDTQLSVEQSLIFVTHYVDEVPSSVNRLLSLDQGRVVERV